MKKITTLLICFVMCITYSINTQAQKECDIEAFKTILATDLDTLDRSMNFIVRNKKVEDMPYFEAFMFTKNKNVASYLMLYTISSEATIKLSIRDFQNNSLIKDSIITKNYRMYQVNPSFKGEYKVILYSSNPDNRCALLSEVIVENSSTKIEIPLFKPFDKVDYKSQGLDLLKEYKQELNGNRDFPLLVEYSYVLTKSAAYYFELAGDQEVKYKLYNNKRELIPLKKSADFPNMYYYVPKQTGIYYIIMYKKEPINKTTSLSMYNSSNI